MNSAIANSTKNSLPRDEYGALNLRQALSAGLQAQVVVFLDSAVKAGLNMLVESGTCSHFNSAMRPLHKVATPTHFKTGT